MILYFISNTVIFLNKSHKINYNIKKKTSIMLSYIYIYKHIKQASKMFQSPNNVMEHH